MTWNDADTAVVSHAVRALLTSIGEDPDRPGLRDTPDRVAAFWHEFFTDQDGARLKRVFTDSSNYDEMVMLRHIAFYSMCEHHLLPFYGTATVAYIPLDGRVLGLSKMARIVRKHAGRLQLQERMTRDIAAEVMSLSETPSVAVSVEAVHLCMAMRGVRTADAAMVTNALFGDFRSEPETRAEFLASATERR